MGIKPKENGIENRTENNGKIDDFLKGIDLSKLRTHKTREFNILRDGKTTTTLKREDALVVWRLLRLQGLTTTFDEKQNTLEIGNNPLPSASVISFFSGTPPGYWGFLIKGKELNREQEIRDDIKKLREIREKGKSIPNDNPILLKLKKLL